MGGSVSTALPAAAPLAPRLSTRVKVAIARSRWLRWLHANAYTAWASDVTHLQRSRIATHPSYRGAALECHCPVCRQFDAIGKGRA